MMTPLAHKGHKTIFGLATLLALSIFIGCDLGGASDDDDDDNDTAGALAQLDLTGAKGIFISQGSSSGRAGEEGENRLFKVTEEGFVLEVSMLDEEGLEVTTVQMPTDLINLTDEFIIVVFGFDEVFLVRLSDGAAYLFEEGIPAETVQLHQYYGEVTSKTASSHIYITDDRKLVGLNTSDPDNLTFETYSATGDKVDSFCADKEGNIAYSGFDNGNSQVLRLRKAAGGFATLPGATNVSHTTYWTDFDDDTIYYYNASLGGDQSTEPNIVKLVPDPFEAVDYGTSNLSVGCGFTSLLKVRNKQSIIALGGCTYIYEVYNEEGEAREIEYEDFGLTSIKFGIASDNFYYIAGVSTGGNSVLLKVDPADDTYQTLVDGTYDIYKMDVSPSDELIFNALKLSDGKIVIGEIDATGAITILDETLENQVLVLERVN